MFRKRVCTFWFLSNTCLVFGEIGKRKRERQTKMLVREQFLTAAVMQVFTGSGYTDAPEQYMELTYTQCFKRLTNCETNTTLQAVLL